MSDSSMQAICPVQSTRSRIRLRERSEVGCSSALEASRLAIAPSIVVRRRSRARMRGGLGGALGGEEVLGLAAGNAPGGAKGENKRLAPEQG
jgi:hypothetical protein